METTEENKNIDRSWKRGRRRDCFFKQTKETMSEDAVADAEGSRDSAESVNGASKEIQCLTSRHRFHHQVKRRGPGRPLRWRAEPIRTSRW